MSSKKRKNYFLGISLALIIAASSSVYFFKSNDSKSISDKKNDNVTVAANLERDEENEKLKSENEKLKSQIDSLTKELENEQNTSKTVPTEIYFPIYTANINDLSKEILCYIKPTSTSIEDNLKFISNKLSQIGFQNLPIEFVKFETVENKKVAVINLKEIITDPNVPGTKWSQSFFQGSTGGEMTSTALIETFLQRDYDGEWIDGVKFLYEGGDIQFQHTEKLSQINYR